MHKSHTVAAALAAGFRLAAAAPCPSGNAGAPSASDYLWVASYPIIWNQQGKLITLQLDGSNLKTIDASDACGTHPAWVTQAGDTLYCVNEWWGGANGTLSTLSVGSDLSLTKLGEAKTLPGPVSTALYGKDGHGLAVANYAGSGINAYNVEDPSAIQLLQTEYYGSPGDNQPSPQDVAHPHQAVVDPTGEFLVFPDLGADKIRVFKVNQETLALETKEGFVYAPEERGTGPRHVVFYKAGDKTFLYVACELKNLVQGFAVEYSDGDLKLTRLFNTTTHGDDKPLPAGTTAAEILLSPDNKFITVSSRNEKSLEFTLADGTTVASDPLVTFKIDPASGALEFVQEAPAGGVNPRHFSFNKDGTLVASALQSDSRIVVFERDVATGKIGKAIAEGNVEGFPNFVIFKE